MSRIEKYGLFWPSTVSELSMEMDCYRHGGRWRKQNGGMAGEGLEYHFKRAISLAWPQIKWHRWADMQVALYVGYRIIGQMGPASTGKTFIPTACALMDYYCHPTCTTVLISSTTRESLEMRVLGELKKLHRLAKGVYNWLPGNLIEGRQRIVTDDRSVSVEGRDFRNGIVGVACKKGQSFQGMEEYVGIKNKRLRMIGDECFPAGTLVDTTVGPKPIQDVRPGDWVLSASGPNRVLGTSVRSGRKLALVKMRDGRQFRCTPKHKFLTQSGWVCACELNQSHYILSPYEAVRILQNSSPQSAFLFSVLQREMDAQPVLHSAAAARPHVGVQKEMVGQPGCSSVQLLRENEGEQSHARPGGVSQVGGHQQSPRDKAHYSRWKRNRAYQGGVATAANVPRGPMELPNQNRPESGVRLPDLLQGGHCVSGIETGPGGGRGFPQRPSPSEGPKEGLAPRGAWVESVAIFKQKDLGFQDPDSNPGRCRVYNLHVDGHPSYSVMGLVCHNCQFLPRQFVDAISNLNKNADFKGVYSGNPKDITDALGVICEPAAHLGGWDGGIDQNGGTKSWETRFPHGVCLQLVGTDSPNLDGKLGIPLITQQQIDEDIAFYGQDSLQFSMMDLGRMPRGQANKRVITRQMCFKFHAMEDPVWKSNTRVKIAALDAAYRGTGGDRCVLGFFEFGAETVAPTAETMVTNIINQALPAISDNQIFALLETDLVPIKLEDPNTPEDQIALYVRAACEERGVDPANFYFDSTGRGSLMSSFGRLWSTAVNGVEFGGSASKDRKVSADIDVVCYDYYFNMVSELWFNVSYCIQYGQFRGLTEEVMAEGAMREWGHQGKKIQVEPKDKMKLKSGRSPDLFDMVVVGMEGARRRGFVLRRSAAAAHKRVDHQWKQDLRDKAESYWKSGQLSYK